MKKFALLLLTFALVMIFGSAMAEENFFFTCEQVEKAFEERFGYWLDVTKCQGLDDDPEGCYFRIPNNKNLEVSYLEVDGFSSDGKIWYVNAQKMNDFFERHEASLMLHAWESLETYNYYTLEKVSDILLEELKVTDRLTMTVDSDDDFFTISVVKDGIELNVEFGSLWRKEITEGKFIYHQAVVTELYKQWHSATADN